MRAADLAATFWNKHNHVPVPNHNELRWICRQGGAADLNAPRVHKRIFNPFRHLGDRETREKEASAVQLGRRVSLAIFTRNATERRES